MEARQLKIVFASQSFYPLIGGVSTYLMNLALGLKERGHSVVEIHLRPPFGESEETIKGIEVYRVPKEPLDRELLEKYSHFKECVYKECHGEEKCFGRPVEEMPGFEAYNEINEIIGKQVSELLSGHPAQVVNIHDFQLLFLYKFIPRGIPLVFTWHIPFGKKMSKHLSGFLISHMNEFDRVIFSSREYIDAAVSLGFPRKKARLIYPLSNTRLFRPLKGKEKYMRKYGIPLNARVVLCVQRIDPKSGHEQLVRAMPLVLKSVPEARLVFVGGESLSSKISSERQKYVQRTKGLVKRLGLSRKVLFIGNVDYEKMPEVYAAADIVALTSKQEGFGLAITEGMACGKPIVGNRTTGIKLQVEHGKNGLLVSVNDHKATAKAIVKILKNEKLAKGMGAYSRKLVKKRFDTGKGITKYIKLFSELVQEMSPKWSLGMLKLEDVEALVLDFDRTLTKRPGKLNRRAFRELKSLKKPLIVASGRNMAFMREFVEKNRGFSAAIAENGSVIYFPKYRETIRIDNDAMREARKKLQKKFPNLSIGSVVVHAPTGMEKQLKEAVGSMKGLKFVRNIDRIMLTPKDIDKGKGVLLALHKMGLNPKRTIVVGDGENDIDLFNVPGFRVAVANAVPQLKALADQVTEHESARGVVEIVEKLKE